MELSRDTFLSRYDENKKYDWVYYHYPERWSEVSLGNMASSKNESHWSDFIKYLDDDHSISQSIRNIPNDSGGIYVFFVQGPTIPFLERHVAYIGRAKKTRTQNLRKRVMEYLPESEKKNSRHKIYRLFRYWKDYLYIRYLTCSDNDTIDNLEKLLIHAIFPPFNDKIVEKIIIKQPKKAF